MKRCCLLSLVAFAAAAHIGAQEETSSRLALDGGADWRFRYEWRENMPGAYGYLGENNADRLRLRTRVWGKAGVDDYSIYARLYNEVREYHHNSTGARNYQHFPSWLVLDNIYLDMKNLLYDRVDMRLGRQDMTYGAGRVIANGSPGETTRMAFNALKVTTRVTEATKADVFGTYMPAGRDWLAVGERGTGYYSTSYRNSYGGSENDDGLREWGLGTYWTVEEMDALPMEFYLLYKDESRWYLNGVDRSARIPGRKYGTAGLRLMPKFTEKLAGEAEGAYQFGRTESYPGVSDGQLISAYMLYGGLTYTEAEWAWKPYAKAATLFLSGDGKGAVHNRQGGAAATATGWNPVYSRYTYFGEIPAAMYGGRRWTNLIWPHGEVGVSPFNDRHAFRAQTGPMFAHRDDRRGAPANDDNRYRGWYSQVSYDYLIIKEVASNRGSLKGRIMVEDMAYGDYHYGKHPSNGYFFRVELVATF